MSESLLARLTEFTPADKTPRLVDAVFKVVPGAPTLTPYLGLPQVVAAMGGGPADVAGAMSKIDDPELADVLWMSAAVDTADKGYAIFTGVGSALKLFFSADKSAALETDTQQRNDAVLKAIALAWMAHKAFDGSIPERAKAFASTPSGKALLTWYAAIEVALPFADNVVTRGGGLVDDLLTRDSASQMSRLSSMSGGRDLRGAPEALQALTGPIKEALDAVRPHMEKVAAAARSHLPGALATGDKVAGALAGVADVMPVYRYLGGRLAAEAAVVRGRG